MKTRHGIRIVTTGQIAIKTYSKYIPSPHYNGKKNIKKKVRYDG